MSTYTATGLTYTTPTASGSLTSLKPISDSLQAMVTAGKLGQSSDTGQVSWGSVLATQTSTNNYEIFYLNDSLHSTYPIYMKFIYATQVTGSAPVVYIQIGVGTDGSGNFVGVRSTQAVFRGFMSGAGLVDSTAQTVWSSAGSGYLNIWGGFFQTGATGSYGGYTLSIERLRDSSGVITGDGINVICSTNGYSGGATTAYNTGSGGVAATFSWPAGSSYIAGCFGAQRYMLPSLFNSANNVWPPLMNHGNSYYNTAMFDGSNFITCAVQPDANKVYSPGIACLLLDTNWPQLNTFTASMYSTSHTYLASHSNCPAFIPVSIPQGPFGQGSYAAILTGAGLMIPAFLYE